MKDVLYCGEAVLISAGRHSSLIGAVELVIIVSQRSVTAVANTLQHKVVTVFSVKSAKIIDETEKTITLRSKNTDWLLRFPDSVDIVELVSCVLDYTE